MTEAQKIEEWCRYFQASLLKMNALRAVLENDGEAMLQKVLKKLGFSSALDVVKNCPDRYTP